MYIPNIHTSLYNLPLLPPLSTTVTIPCHHSRFTTTDHHRMTFLTRTSPLNGKYLVQIGHHYDPNPIRTPKRNIHMSMVVPFICLYPRSPYQSPHLPNNTIAGIIHPFNQSPNFDELG